VEVVGSAFAAGWKRQLTLMRLMFAEVEYEVLFVCFLSSRSRLAAVSNGGHV